MNSSSTHSYNGDVFLWLSSSGTTLTPFLIHYNPLPVAQAADLQLPRYTSFSDELADRSTSWASKNSETDSDMESRLSLDAC